MEPAIRLYRDPSGTDLRKLRAGRDLVLDVHPRQGLDLPEGVLIDDYLSAADRRAVDEAAASALARWRNVHDAPLTLNGLCLPWTWELELFSAVFLPAARAAAGLRRALQTHRCEIVEVARGDDRLTRIVRAVGASVRLDESARPPARSARGRRVADVRAGVHRLGVRSMLRSGSVVVAGYWHLAPVADRILADGRLRPALTLHAPLPGRSRSLRVARCGGWIGLPGPIDRRRAGNQARRLAAEVVATPADVLGCRLDDLLLDDTRGFVEHKGRRDLALWRMLDRVFRQGLVRAVVVPFDVVTEPRLLVTAAAAAGIPTVVVQHGGYLEPERYADLQVAETVLLWSDCARVAAAGRKDGLVVVGYPGPRPAAAARSAGSQPTVVVLGESLYTTSIVRDARQMQQHDAAAIEGILAVDPAAKIILRPHPSSGRESAEAVRRRYPDAAITVDTTSEIFDVLRDSDACVGTYSTAAMQAALVDTPVVLLNVAGEHFPWPLGGETPVSIARSSEDVARCLRELLADPAGSWGQDALRAALGVTDDDVVGRIVNVVVERALG